MRLIARLRPSPAMLVACLALLTALAGASVAAVSGTTPTSSSGSDRIASHLKVLAPAPLAFAHVNGNDRLDRANSRRVAVIATAAVGVFCLNVTTAQAPRNIVASLDLSGQANATDQIRATLVRAVVNFNCGGTGADTLVETTRAGGGAALPFYITVN